MMKSHFSKLTSVSKIRLLIDWYEFIVDNTAALYLVFIFLSILNLVCFPLPTAKRVKNAYDYKLKEPENKQIFVFSAYFYDTGPKNGEVSIVFFGNREAKWERKKIFIAGRNGTKSNSKRIKLHRATPHNMCEYITFVGNALLVENMKALELIYEESISQINFKTADSVPRGFVVCTPPIHETTKWENVLKSVRIHQKFGAHVQVYFARGTSTLLELFQKLQLEIDNFPSEYSDKLEFGGTTVANCDCLHQYKNSANYITFLEWDEILLIENSKKSYFDEFSNIFMSQPLVGIVVIESRGLEGPQNRKRFVTRPDLINTVWNGREGRRPYQMGRINATSEVRIEILEPEAKMEIDGMDDKSSKIFKRLEDEKSMISRECRRDEDSDVWKFNLNNFEFYKCSLLPKRCDSKFTFLKFYCSENSNFSLEFVRETRHFTVFHRKFGKMESVVKC